MIKNILFDMGEVLLRWDPDLFMDKYDLSQSDRVLIRNEIFHSYEWVMMDRGTLNYDSFLNTVLKRVPERLHDIARALVIKWHEPDIITVDGMYELVKSIHDNGYPLYLLSNASLGHPEYWPKLPVSEFFGDNLFVSAFYKTLKPEPEFYEKALSKFGLQAAECIFIDDNPVNIESAVRMGINGIVFHNDVQLLRKQLTALGIHC